MPPRSLRPVLLALLLPLLAGCDVSALLADPKAAQKAADAKAVGNACRHGMRSIEDCYSLNEKMSKAAIFEGWKEMDQYMRENKIDGVEPKGLKPPPPPPPPPAPKVEEIIEENVSNEKPRGKAGH
ncbi:MAG: hypothetical protein IPH35_10810 [Rhodoferax sp.]|nr:hypothetical protein [Rhodoferax sp.]